MGKKQTCPAIRLKEKKAKILAANLHCNIPKARQPKSNHDAIKAYEELRKARKEELKKFSDSPARHTRSKTPWYMLSKAKYHYETRKESWGNNTQWFKVESESTQLYNKTAKKKFTREQLVVGLVKTALKKWEKTNPEPKELINGTKNAFYSTEHHEWIEERTKVYTNTLNKVKRVYGDQKDLVTKYLKQTNPDLLKAA